MTDTPHRLRVPLPETGMFPRVGKIRLGRQETSTRTGNLFPKAVDHFVVAEDESGITTAEAAASFHEVYGPEPRSIRAMLVGRTPEENFEGAWRLYGVGKLKRRCDGETCSERTPSGFVPRACVCRELGLADDDREHCKLTYTLQLVLPDVSGVGVWQLDTGSAISANRMTQWLRMMESFTGDLRGTEFDLRVVPVSVAPDGEAKTVYVLDPRATGQTPRQAIAAAATSRPDLPALPAPDADEHEDVLLSRPPTPPAPDGPTEDTNRVDEPPPATPPSSSESEPPPLVDAVKHQIRAWPKDDRARLERLATMLGVPATIGKLGTAIAEAYGEEARDLPALVEQADRIGVQTALSEGAPAA